MKIKNVSTRVVTFALVKSGSECWVDNVKVIKVRSKTAMTTDGAIITLADSYPARIKLK